MDLGALERDFINRYQGGFPLDDRPFREVARELGSDEQHVLTMIGTLLDDGWLTRFGPLYDAEHLGGGMTLAAMAVAERQFEDVAAYVNSFAEVAHNYRRDHHFNMWFVISADSQAAIDRTLKSIAEHTGLPVLNLPKLQEFYVGLWLHISADGTGTTCSLPHTPATRPAAHDSLDWRIAAATQAGLPLVERPWAEIAAQAGCDTSDVLSRLQRMLSSGMIRRIGAVPNHYRLGFKCNGMTVWDIPDEQVTALGERVGALDFVSHCYERPRCLPDWPYNLFAMVHGHDADEIDEKVAQSSAIVDGQSRAHEILFSTRILKKTGLRLVA